MTTATIAAPAETAPRHAGASQGANGTRQAARLLSYGDALNEALHQEMARDERVFVYGIETKAFGSLRGLAERFGPARLLTTPICEEAMTGFGLGAAINGLRPVHVHIRVDFFLLAMNQLANMIAGFHYGVVGGLPVPLVIRAIVGRGWGQGFQHSKSLQSIFAHFPGLKVIMPTTAYDAKGMLTAAIRDDNPVVSIEHRWLYWQEGEVPEAPYTVPIGPGRVLRDGGDVTIVATSWMNVEAVQAADILARRGVSVEVVDVRTLAPLDDTVMVESVAKTGRCVVADCDWVSYGASAEIAARIGEKAFGRLKAPIERVGFAPAPCPTARELENAFYPNAGTLVRAAERTLGLSPADLSGENFYSHERRFTGPF
jgi:pyruvate dehydrogenase E1 component beta subunit